MLYGCSTTHTHGVSKHINYSQTNTATMHLKVDAAIVETAMAQLVEADRMVLRLFYFERQSYAQISQRMGLSINTIGPKMKRAQQRLRKILHTQYPDSRTR